MDGIASVAMGALGNYPIVQSAVALIIVAGGIFAMFRGSKDQTVKAATVNEPSPEWTAKQVLEDVRRCVHEHHRTNDLLRDILEAIIRGGAGRPDDRR